MLLVRQDEAWKNLLRVRRCGVERTWVDRGGIYGNSRQLRRRDRRDGCAYRRGRAGAERGLPLAHQTSSTLARAKLMGSHVGEQTKSGDGCASLPGV